MRRQLIISTLILISVYWFNGFAYAGPTGVDVKYFVVEPGTNEYQLHAVTLNAFPLYRVNKQVEVFNVNYKSSLIVFSVLPEANENESWEQVDLAKVSGSTLTFEKLKARFEPAFFQMAQAGRSEYQNLKRMDIIPIVKRNGKYYKAKQCLSEYFKIVSQAVLFPNQMGSCFINVQSPAISVRQFEERYQALYGKFSPNALLSGDPRNGQADKETMYRSDSLQVGGRNAYKFWLYSDWSVDDGLNKQRGLDRLIYSPELGIVGGSYDFWFVKYPMVHRELIHDNYFTEKVMFPVSIDGKKI